MRQYFKSPTERNWYIALVLAVAVNIGMTIHSYKPVPFKMYPQEQYQQFLIDSGYPLPKYGVDGDCGKEMNGAWDDYNRDHNKR